MFLLGTKVDSCINSKTQDSRQTDRTQKVDKMVGTQGKNLISGLLTVLRRPVYASGHYKHP